MRSKLPYHVTVAIVSALALSFAAVVEGASDYSSAAAETAHAQRLVADLAETAPLEYFPGRHQSQVKDIEPLPPEY